MAATQVLYGDLSAENRVSRWMRYIDVRVEATRSGANAGRSIASCSMTASIGARTCVS